MLRVCVCLLLLVAHLTYANHSEKDAALTGLHKFEVLTLFSSKEKVSPTCVFNAETEALKHLGAVTSVESDSMLVSLAESSSSFPVCYFSISIDDECVQLTLEVLAEVEVVANKYRTSSSIWKKTLYASAKEQNDAVVANLIQDLIKNFADDLQKANSAKKQKMVFYIHKCKEF